MTEPVNALQRVQLFAEYGPLTRGAIAEKYGLSRTVVDRIAREDDWDAKRDAGNLELIRTAREEALLCLRAAIRDVSAIGAQAAKIAKDSAAAIASPGATPEQIALAAALADIAATQAVAQKNLATAAEVLRKCAGLGDGQGPAVAVQVNRGGDTVNVYKEIMGQPDGEKILDEFLDRLDEPRGPEGQVGSDK